MSSDKKQKKKNKVVKLKDLDRQENNRLEKRFTEAFQGISIPNISDVSNIIPNSLTNIASVASNFWREEPIVFTPQVDYNAENNRELRDMKQLLKNLDKKEENLKHQEKWIFLNMWNWDVLLDWELIGYVNLQTQPWKFFSYLYSNKGIYKTHREIVEWVYWWVQSSSKTFQSKTSDWKRKLNKDIWHLITTQTWGYLIR